MGTADVVEVEFTDEVGEWRGPAPFHFVSVPVDLCDDVQDAAEARWHRMLAAALADEGTNP